MPEGVLGGDMPAVRAACLRIGIISSGSTELYLAAGRYPVTLHKSSS